MKKILIVFFLFLLSPAPVSAHLLGQPPFFRINGIYSNLYPVPTTSLATFNLPQDLADKNYLVGQKLDFLMETNLLPVPQDIVNQTKFVWDFGDGIKGTGIKNSHVYTQMGSYILTITAQYGSEQSALIQSVLFNVLPDPNYQLPKAVILINGQGSKDPLTDILKFKFDAAMQFDASKSTGGSGKVSSFLWDFGDANSSSDAVTSYKYHSDPGQLFPVLRIKNTDGFIADNFVEIENANLSPPNQPLTNLQNKVSNALPTPVKKSLFDMLKVPGLSIILVVVSLVILLRLRSKHR